MITEKLAAALDAGIRQIGQIAILPDTQGAAFALCHVDDLEHLEKLEVHRKPAVAREISTWAEDGHYRFTKGELSLKTGWLLLLDHIGALRHAIDLFYPAALGLWVADNEGNLEIQHLRDKLERQTGMYKFARNISDTGAQQLVQQVCGPSNCCVKKILWGITADIPLEDSEASRFNGIIGDPTTSIPLLCREACNHFVAECRKASKAEFAASQND